ncbi:MAG: hypothetical protein ABH967_01420 [Patescibacteria group bacterium]
MKKKLTKSLRKHIRLEKAQIRKKSLNLKDVSEKIAKMYQKLGIKKDES